MFQTIQGYHVFVVDFDTMPELPITADKPEEEFHARALTLAIQDGVITEPGKYGVHIPADSEFQRYSIFVILE